ncbi:MAG: transposase family protein [Gemmatimonadetes bacterium]|nr:transposase family protein [Gemmatimonadota bacterium]
MKKTSKGGTVGRRERRAFSAEFKAEAVRLVSERRAEGMTLAQVGRELDVRPEQLCAWTLAESGGREDGVARAGETIEPDVRRLRRENATLRQEQAFAKKVAVSFAKESR